MVRILNFVRGDDESCVRYSNGDEDVEFDALTACHYLLPERKKHLYLKCKTVNCYGDKCRRSITDWDGTKASQEICHCDSCNFPKEEIMCNYVYKTIGIEGNASDDTSYVLCWKGYPLAPSENLFDGNWEITGLELIKKNVSIPH